MNVSNAQNHKPAIADTASCGPRSGPEEQTPVYTSGELFGGASEIGIDHHGARYRLKITRQGKLILNK